MASKNLKLGVEVRQREQLPTADEQVPAASPSADDQLPAASLSAEGLLQARARLVPHEADGAAAGASAREEVDSSILDRVQQMLQSGRLQERRLNMYAGPYGYELMSGGSASQSRGPCSKEPSLCQAAWTGGGVGRAFHGAQSRRPAQANHISSLACHGTGE